MNEKISQAVSMIKESKRPFIYAGGGVVSCNAVADFKEFVKNVDAPVSLSLMGQCAFDNSDDRITSYNVCYTKLLRTFLQEKTN